MPRRTLFTPSVMKHIGPWVDQGLTANEIARKIGCTTGTLRVRCSHAHISLRRRANGSGRVIRTYPRALRIENEPSSTIQIRLTLSFNRRELENLVREVLVAKRSRTLRHQPPHRSRQRRPYSRSARHPIEADAAVFSGR
jgi:hypothetical protein